jgi:hypothetical protein
MPLLQHGGSAPYCPGNLCIAFVPFSRFRACVREPPQKAFIARRRGFNLVTVTPTDVFKPTSRFITIPASGFTSVDFTIDKKGGQNPGLAERLKRYGLENRAGDLTDLRVPRGTRLHLKADDPRVANLRPKTAADLKQWLGIPNNAVAQPAPAPNNPPGFVARTNCYPFLPQPAIQLPDAGFQNDLISYLIRDSSSVTDEGVAAPQQLYCNSTEQWQGIERGGLLIRGYLR